MADSQSEAEPDDSWTPWAMRRREASDDEEEDTSGEDKPVRTNRRAFTGFDDLDSEGEGRAPEDDYDDDVSYFDELRALGKEEEKQVPFQEKEENQRFSCRAGEEEEDKIKNEEVEAVEVPTQRRQEDQNCEERIPVGAFWMHDDRFQSDFVEPRLTFGRKNLRQFKDEKKWQHDKFQELGQRFNARPKVHMISVLYNQLNQGYYKKKVREKDVKANLFKTKAGYDGKIAPSRNVRGRGPVKYRPLNSNNDIVPRTGNKELRKFPGFNSRPFDHSYGVSSPIRNKEKLRGVNSNSYSAKVDSNSLPKERQRHCASSSNPNMSVTDKTDVQSGKVEGYFQNTPLPGDNTSMEDPNVYLQGKTIADSSGRGRLYTPFSQSSLPTRTMEPSQLMSQTWDFPFSVSNAHQSTAFYNVGQGAPTKNNHAIQQAPAGYTQQLSRHSGINSEALSLSRTDLRIMKSFASPSEAEITWAGMGSRNNQGYRSSCQLGESHEPQIFPTTAPLFSAVQFSNQHINDGQHAVDWAFDKSVVQHQFGFGNSGMAWTPGLPDNFGLRGSDYVNPTGKHHAFSLGQESSTGIANNEADADKAFKGSLTLDGTEDVKSGSRNQRSKFQRY